MKNIKHGENKEPCGFCFFSPMCWDAVRRNLY